MYEHIESPALRQRQDARGDFVHRVLADFVAAIGAERAAGARVEQAEVVVNFRGRRDRRARIARGVLLLDGDGGSDAGDFIHVRLLDALEKLPRIRRKRFDVAPLALGVNRVKREARFARSGNPRDHRDRVVRNIEADVLQVVDARPAHADGFLLRHTHCRGWPPIALRRCVLLRPRDPTPQRLWRRRSKPIIIRCCEKAGN